MLLTPVVYFTAATVPAENVSAKQTDDQTAYVSWSAISSDRQPHVNSDITHYEMLFSWRHCTGAH